MTNDLIPHNLDAEAALLGSMILHPRAVESAIEARLTPGDFYKPAHAVIARAIYDIHERGEAADAVTLQEELRATAMLNAAGGGSTIVGLLAQGAPQSTAPRYAAIVVRLAVMRRLMAVGQEIASLGQESSDAPADTLGAAEKLLYGIGDRLVTDSLADMRALLDHQLSHLEELAERGDTVTGVATGYDSLDHQLSGLQPSNLVVVGARPGMGKSAFALGAAANAARAGTPVLMFSLEMSHLELTQRLLSAEAMVDSTRLRNGRLHESDWPKIANAVERIVDIPLHIDDNPHLTISEIRAKARRVKTLHGLGLVVVDYIQLMSGRSAENRQVEVSELSRGLKILARELDLPVLALSQLSRGLETRADKRPILSDLRESGAIEQDSDVVIFLYRDELYDAGTADRGKAEVIVAKHRNGALGTSRLAFVDRYAMFGNLTNQEERPAA